MNRKDLIEKIAKYTARFEAEVKSYNDMGLYDINIHSENALIPILNIVYGLQVINVNANGVRNIPAVDLEDEANKVAFQVTATTGIEKVKKTLETFSNYKLNERYETLYIFVLTQKQGSYSEKSLEGLLPPDFYFDVNKHIIDLSDLRAKVMDIQSIATLTHLAKLLEHEFSDIQTSERKKVFQDKFLKNEPEKIFLNFLRIHLPEKLFLADVAIDEEMCAESINGGLRSAGKPIFKSFKPETLFREAKKLNEVYGRDYILHENKVITFRNLNDPKQYLRKLIDTDSIIELRPADYYGANDTNVDVFKHLLRETLIDLGNSRGLEWIGFKNILRFRNNRLMPNAVKKSWRKKNYAVKTVIFEMMSKVDKEGNRHIICYRNMAFEPSFEYIDDEWYLVINPTWSFTNPFGYKTSRFEPTYMAGLKKQERNNAVYYQYRFWCYFLMFPDIQSPNSRHLHFEPFDAFNFSPSIEDSKWLPQKVFKPSNEREAELEMDNELSLKFFES